jgi:hypothetical protein
MAERIIVACPNTAFQLYNPNHENDLPLPLYRRLANHYLSAMKAGTLVVGDRMPSGAS